MESIQKLLSLSAIPLLMGPWPFSSGSSRTLACWLFVSITSLNPTPETTGLPSQAGVSDPHPSQLRFPHIFTRTTCCLSKCKNIDLTLNTITVDSCVWDALSWGEQLEVSTLWLVRFKRLAGILVWWCLLAIQYKMANTGWISFRLVLF